MTRAPSVVILFALVSACGESRRPPSARPSGSSTHTDTQMLSCYRVCTRLAECTALLCNEDLFTTRYDEQFVASFRDSCINTCNPSQLAADHRQNPGGWACYLEQSCSAVFRDHSCSGVRTSYSCQPDDPIDPPRWTCDPSYRGSADACDCGCGELDPDCFSGCSTPGCTAQSCDVCFDQSGTAQLCFPSQIYGAHQTNDGARCGSSAGLSPRCVRGDLCLEPASNTCYAAGSSYSAASTPLSGARCGRDAVGYDTFCEEGDLCISTEQMRCLRHPVYYSAFYRGSGPDCGRDEAQALVRCDSGDTCVDPSHNACARG